MPLPELAFENQWSGHKQAGGETQVHSGIAKGTEEGTHGAQQIASNWDRMGEAPDMGAMCINSSQWQSYCRDAVVP